MAPARALLAALLPAALALAAGSARAEGGETRVESARPVDSDDDREPMGDHWLSAAPEDALQHALGATLVHEGGPLAPVRPMVRGLSSARLSVLAGGLALTDPATGLIDAALLPWAATEAVVVESGADGTRTAGGAFGGALRLELVRGPALRARVLAGSASTARASLAAADASTLVAVDVGTSRGDFTFVPTSAVAAPAADPTVRTNNDRQRASLLVGVRKRAGAIDVDALALAAAHSGGIPGFALSPTRGLRGEDAVAGGRVAIAHTDGGARIGLEAQARAAHRATFGPEDARSVIESGAARAQASLAAHDEGVQLDLVTGADHAALLGAGGSAVQFARDAVDAGGAVGGALGGVRLRGTVDGRLTTDAGPLWGAGARAEVGDVWRAFAGVSRASRAPTLDELYAPRGVVLGNPALRPEALADAELGVAVLAPRIVEARAVAFAGRIDDAIVYLNKNAFEIEPANVGAGWRAGVDISMSIEPTEWLALGATAGLLASRMDVTGSPLPLAPPFASTLSLRTGPADGTSATVVVHSRASAPSNAFGTLESSSYSLVDFLLRAPIAPHLALGCAVTNALDALDARDANGLPLPGRLLFLSLEVSG